MTRELQAMDWQLSWSAGYLLACSAGACWIPLWPHPKKTAWIPGMVGGITVPAFAGFVSAYDARSHRILNGTTGVLPGIGLPAGFSIPYVRAFPGWGRLFFMVLYGLMAFHGAMREVAGAAGVAPDITVALAPLHRDAPAVRPLPQPSNVRLHVGGGPGPKTVSRQIRGCSAPIGGRLYELWSRPEKGMARTCNLTLSA